MTLPAAVPAPGGLRLDEVEKGILWPVVYASIFGAPVDLSSLPARLVGVAASEEAMRGALSGAPLRSLVVESGQSVWLRSLFSAEAERRHDERKRRAGDLLRRHEAVLEFVGGLPGVRLAALSGGCAHGAVDDDDIDVFIVAEARMLWRTLLWTTLVAKARGWRRTSMIFARGRISWISPIWAKLFGILSMKNGTACGLPMR